MEHFEPFKPNQEQAKDNPNKKWEGFLSQTVTLVSEMIKEKGNISDSDISKALNDAMEKIPQNKTELISKEEILIRALELYAKENGGFGNEKLKKEYIEKLAHFLSQELHDYEFDNVDQELQKEIEAIQKAEVLNSDDLKELRDKFGSFFSDIKMKEYSEEFNGDLKE